MDFNRLTIKSGEAVAAAQELARRRGNPEVYPEHLCIALLDQELPRTLVERAGQSVDSLRAECEAKLAQKPAVQGSSQQPHASAEFGRVLDKAEEEMRELEDEYVSTEHLLLALDVAPRHSTLFNRPDRPASHTIEHKREALFGEKCHGINALAINRDRDECGRGRRVVIP